MNVDLESGLVQLSEDLLGASNDVLQQLQEQLLIVASGPHHVLVDQLVQQTRLAVRTRTHRVQIYQPVPTYVLHTNNIKA